MKRCIINVSIGDDVFVKFQDRLISYCKKYIPDIDVLTWTQKMPIGSKPHNESMYGFKMYAFEEAFNMGYDSVIWLDAGTVIKKSIFPLFSLLEKDENGVFTLYSDADLSNYVNDKTVKYFDVSRDDMDNQKSKLNYGFVFGFTKESVAYKEMMIAENCGLFGTFEENQRDTEINCGVLYNGKYVSHRHEEAVLSTIIHKRKIQIFNHNDFYHMIWFDNERKLI